jgi:hypothetical protein
MGTSDCIFLLFAIVQSMACGPILLYLQYAVFSFILRGGKEGEEYVHIRSSIFSGIKSCHRFLITGDTKKIYIL